jgi:DNA-binding NarL/FixJ family response regulator
MGTSGNKIPYPSDAPERAERLYAEGKMDHDVAAEFGVSRQIIYLWRSREKTFDEACERGKEAGEDIRRAAVSQTMSESIRGSDSHALAAIASRKMPPTDAAETIGKLCALGHTDFEIAQFFGISAGSVLNRWKAEFPAIAEAFTVGKGIADARVERSLFNRAVGYSYDAIKIFNDKGAVTKVDYVEHMPPDTGAAVFWLKNRMQEKWRDRREVIAPGTDGKNLNDLSGDELDRQVVEALRRAQELDRRVNAALRAQTSTPEGDDKPDRVH